MLQWINNLIFKKAWKVCSFIFNWKYPIIKPAVSCKLSPLHLPIASFLCKTVNLKATWFFFFFSSYAGAYLMFPWSFQNVCQSVSQGKNPQHLILYKIVMGCSLENPMLAKLSELAQIPFAHPISLAAFLLSISHYSPFAWILR